ncbi:MAG: sigma-70 family RNA polymerase sigma factor [Planctomycetes bacterium]|nr:sigma-70 family RNA polymerase sigma factor [Planctomycetota bacterium]
MTAPDDPPGAPREFERHARRVSLAERILGSLPGLTRFVRRRMGPDLAARESASDIVQSTCRELLRAGSSFEDRGEASFQRWLQSAAEHKLQNRARHWSAQRRQGGARSLDAGSDDAANAAHEPAAPASSHPSQEAELREETERLARAFRALPDEYRVAIVRSQVDGATPAELAREFDRSPEAVRKLVARALARLSAELDPDQPGESERTGRTPIQ